jgi:hypothetical protein
MNKQNQDTNNLEAIFPFSVSLARKVHRAEHRANPFLNILNMTDKSVCQYPDLLGKKGWLWRLFNSMMSAGITLLRALFYWRHAIPFLLPKASADIVIISHLTSISHLTKKDDFYIGDLVNQLETADYKTHTVLINHCRAKASDISKSSRNGVTILPAFNSPWGEVKLLMRMLGASFSIPSIGTRKDELSFVRKASLAQFNSRAVGDYRIGKMILSLIAGLKPRIILHTFEGHGWERLVTAEAHQMTVQGIPPHIIGYQHAVIFPGLKSLCFNHGNGADPDHVFTSGIITHDHLQREASFPPLSILGSVRATSVNKAKFSPNGACLIAPEGTLSEVMIMSKIAITAAHLSPDQVFILRLHPVLNREMVNKKLKKHASFPDNFKLSKQSLHDDFTQSSFLCYRGSSVALEGILHGLRPIYLDPDQLAANNDPIDPMLSFRRLASNAEDLVKIIKEDYLDPRLGAKELPEALTYAKSYFMPLEPNVLINHIKKFLS